MNVTLVGSGNMASALATRLAQAGHKLRIVGRDSAKAAALASRIGAEVTAPATAARDADVVIVATGYGDAAPARARRSRPRGSRGDDPRHDGRMATPGGAALGYDRPGEDRVGTSSANRAFHSAMRASQP